MNRVNLALADGDERYLQRYRNALGGMEGIRVVVATMDGGELIEHIVAGDVDIVVTGLMLKGIDGLAVLEALRKMKAKAPKCIVVSHVHTESIVHAALERGVSYYLLKPVRSDILYERIRLITDCERESDEEERDALGIRRKIAAALRQIGIAPSMKGYRCLEDAVMLRLEDANKYSRLTGSVYPRIAEMNDISAVSVERSIRTAIAGAWNRGAIQRYALENNDNRLLCERPTAGQMIDRLSVLIRETPKSVH